MGWVTDKNYKGIEHNQDSDGEWLIQAKFTGSASARLGREKLVLQMQLISERRIHLTTHEAVIALDQLSGITIKPSGFMSLGMMWFQAPSYPEQTPYNGIGVPKGFEKSAEFFRERVLATAKDYSRRKRSLDHSQPTTSKENHSLADELRKLKALFDEGVLSPEEYAQAKKRVLG